LQTYQKLGGGNYGKGPIALPEGSLCEFIKNDTVIFPALKKSTNLPKKCPLKKVNMQFVIFFTHSGDSTT
jgi:hypothetical protein